MIGNYLTMSEFADEFRKAVGDATCEIPMKSIINWTNTALRRLAREKGLDVLFRYQDSFELANMNKDGSKSVSWFLKGFKVDDEVDSPRIGTIIDELRGEKIDIVRYSEDPAEFIREALSPAEVSSVEIDSERSARVTVYPDQLSLAIGKEGQNARLAARLTGFRIDIKA